MTPPSRAPAVPLVVVVALAVVACLAAACTDPRTDIVVRVDSDLRPGTELSAVRVVVQPQEADAGPSADLTIAIGAGPGQHTLPLDAVGVVPRGGDANRTITVTATAVGADGGVLVTTRRAARFTPHVTTVLEVFLARACQGVVCDPDQSCGRDGACAPVLQTDLPAYDGGPNTACPSPQSACEAQCVDLQSDPVHCGACANRCAAGATCTAGACVCPGGATVCGDRCVDIASDPANCGGCGRACAARCGGGVCHPAVGVAAGRAFSCAALDDGTAWCWGDDSLSQLGRGAGMAGSSSLPVPVASTVAAAQIAAGSTHACLVARDDARVLCWGNGQGGRLGTGMGRTEVPTVAPLPAGVRATELALAASHSCAATSDGVYCWGAGDGCGVGDAMTVVATPSPTRPRTDATRVAASGAASADQDFSVAVDASGFLRGWGANVRGALMTAVSVGSVATAPVALPDAQPYERVAAGADFACGVRRATHRVYCWGAGMGHRLGVASTLDSTAPVLVATLPAQAVDVAASAGHACALLMNGDLWCWGDTVAGATRTTVPTLLLGPSVAADAPAPALRTGPITAVACGPDHDCALEMGGGVICWGVNTDGQLGIGNSAQVAGAVRVDWGP